MDQDILILMLDMQISTDLNAKADKKEYRNRSKPY